jgi:ubiquinone/menaquinone biosynthesis C-methylase UbiE
LVALTIHEWAEKKFIINKGAKVLDLGCRDGSYTKIFQNKVKKNGSVFGVDKNLELLKTAKKRFRKIPENVSYKYLNYDKILNIMHSFD